MRSSTHRRRSAPDCWRDLVDELLDMGEGGKGWGVLDRGASGRGWVLPEVRPSEGAPGVTLNPPVPAAKNHT